MKVREIFVVTITDYDNNNQLDFQLFLYYPTYHDLFLFCSDKVPVDARNKFRTIANDGLKFGCIKYQYGENELEAVFIQLHKKTLINNF